LNNSKRGCNRARKLWKKPWNIKRIRKTEHPRTSAFLNDTNMENKYLLVRLNKSRHFIRLSLRL
jgi:hypothetical protein